jgi:hypothetical protein
VNAKKENKELKEELEKMRAFYIKSLNIHNENKELKKIPTFVIVLHPPQERLKKSSMQGLFCKPCRS